jgi:tetratricopeptide (TPR) repeat protein
MAKHKFTVRFHRRIALFLFLFSISAVLLVAIPANAQRQNRSGTSLDDRLFQPQVYSQLKSSGEVEGRLIGPQYAGQKLSRDQVAVIALERFIEAATSNGVPEKDITKAIFEGRFNPDFEDLQLAGEGFGKPTAAQLPPGYNQASLQNDEVRERLYANYRDGLWNHRFSSIADMGLVSTIINGQEVKRSSQDILLRIYMYKNFSELPKYYRQNPNANLTYDQMVARFREEYPDISQYQYEVKSLESTLKFRVGHISAYSYFKLVAKDCCPTFDLRKDYEDLRTKIYIPSAQKTFAKTNSAPPTAARPSSPRETPAASHTTKKAAIPLRIAGKATCDDLAAHPEDKGRTGAGVADEKIVYIPAIEKCSQAVRQSPTVARFHFQLGRAYWAAKRYDEALDAFLKAEEMNYAPAYFYLGQAYEQGLIEGEKADPAIARNLYMIAASEGFEPAVRAYQESMGDEPDFSEFKQPALLQALYEENLEALNKDRRQALLYIRGIYNLLEAEPDFEGADPTCRKILDPAISKELSRIVRVEILQLNPEPSILDGLELLRRGQQPGYMKRAEAEAAFAQQGTDDFYLFAYDYGTCEGAAVGKVYATIKRFVMGRKAPSR